MALGLPPRTAKQLTTRFDELLLDPKLKNWDRGWEEARTLGALTEPVLIRMLDSASSVRKRVLLTGALVAAVGVEADEVILGRVLRSGDPRERTFGLFALALGPRRSGEPPAGLVKLARTDGPAVVRIAACLLLERYDQRPRRDTGFAWPDDPGVAAAAGYAGMRVPESSRFERLWRGDHGQLLWRGYFCGTQPPRHAVTHGQELALRVLSTRKETDAEARRAAAYWVGRAPGRSAVAPRLRELEEERDELALLVGLDPEMRRILGAGAESWWQPVPSNLLPKDERARLGVIHVLHHDLAVVRTTAARWGSDGDVAGAACLALAWRLLRDGNRDRVWPEGLPDLPADLPEAVWLEWSLGVDTPTRAKPVLSSDAELDAAWLMAREGRLPPAAAAEALEQALWRRGAHPMLSLLERRREFVRDVLLSGSRRVSGANVGKAYQPDGIEPNERWFEWADEFFKFLRVPKPRPDDDLRLERMLDQG